MDEPTRKFLVEGFRAAYPPTDELVVAFGECRIAVETNSPALREALAAYYQGFLAEGRTVDIRITVHEAPAQALALPFVVNPPDPGKTRLKEEYVDLPGGRVVRKRLTGMSFIFGDGDHLAVGPCLENNNQIVNFVNNRYIEWRLRRGCFLGHAAGVALNGRGVALAGFSGMGKSTLALHLMSRGTLFVSNDRMIVEKGERGLTMHGVAKQPRINPGTALANPDLADILVPEERDRFSHLSEVELWNLEYKYDAPIETCFGPGRFVLTSPMNALVILNWKRGNEALAVRSVVPEERKELLSAFRKRKGLFYLPSKGAKVQDPSLDTYAELLSDCTVVEMAGGTDFQGAVNACLRLLEGNGV